MKAYRTDHAYNTHDGYRVYGVYAFDCLELDDGYIASDVAHGRADFGGIIVSGTQVYSGDSSSDEYKGGMDWRREYE